MCNMGDEDREGEKVKTDREIEKRKKKMKKQKKIEEQEHQRRSSLPAGLQLTNETSFHDLSISNPIWDKHIGLTQQGTSP